MKEKGARRDESAAGAGCALSVPGGVGGRGWKRVGSRTELALSTANDRGRATSKRRCLDCDGSGKE
ncbi:hypothetical protein GCM10020256_35370 [Streptomyces thermocoprophilus]